MITALLELHFSADRVVDGRTMLTEILVDTRTFDGCLSIEILTDVDDPAHIVVVERWDSLAHDLAYRSWRAGPGASELGTVLAVPARLTKFETTDLT